MPGNSSARCAAIRSSSGRKSLSPSRGRTRTNRGDVVGHLDPGEPLGPGLRVADDDARFSDEPGDVGERVRRVDRQRGQHREDLRGEVRRPAGPRSVGVDRSQCTMRMPASASAGMMSSVKQRRLPVDQFLGAGGDQRELLARRSARRRWSPSRPMSPAALQPGDPDHVELVEVRGEDRQELRPLQQRLAVSSASASTRALKSSQLSSRLEKRSSGSGSSSAADSCTASDGPPWNGSIAASSTISGRRTCRCRPRCGAAVDLCRCAPRRSGGARGVGVLPAVEREFLLAVTWHSPVSRTRIATARGEQQVSTGSLLVRQR